MSASNRNNEFEIEDKIESKNGEMKKDIVNIFKHVKDDTEKTALGKV